MKLFGKSRLTAFIQGYPDAKSWIEAWIAEVEYVSWRTPQDIKNRYGSASFLANNVVIFNVKGNAYRLAVQFAYKTGNATALKVGTHAEYDTWKF